MLSDFAVLLKRRMGLDAESIGISAIARAVKARSEACDLQSAEAYWAHVQSSDAELRELIEALIVPETWFFREPEAFKALARIASEWLPAAMDERLRLLSVPCSSGEEPYSMAMTLLDSGFPARRIHIDAIDISARSLEKATRGTYNANSFRGADIGFRARHFEAAGAVWQLAANVRRLVHFRQGNLVDPPFLPDAEPYDVIFCRNVLIYFDRTTQDHVVCELRKRLAPDGVIFVAPAEASLLVGDPFVSIKVPLAFGFQRSTRKPTPAPYPSPLPSARAKPPATPRSDLRIEPRAPASAEARPRRIDAARRLADEGSLKEAAALCKEDLAERGPSGEAYHLLGLAEDAQGHFAEAAEAYRKAIYLEPEHEEALHHLAFLLEARGDRASAGVLRARARRSESKRRLGK